MIPVTKPFAPPLEEYQKLLEGIWKRSWFTNNGPLVSICCNAYNHGSYIHDALEGFLMQKTTFPVEIQVHDDASTDRSADIIREYESLHPSLYKVIYQKENQYSKGIKPFVRFQLPHIKSKYIAACEGDDYWTDPLKLQKQVAFLEQNPEYVLTYHPWVESMNGELKEPRDMFPSTHTLVVRNVKIDFSSKVLSVLNGDTVLLYLLKRKGAFAMLDDIQPAVKRRDSGGVWNALPKYEQARERVKTIEQLLNTHQGTAYYKKVSKMYLANLLWCYRIEKEAGRKPSSIHFYVTLVRKGLLLLYIRKLYKIAR